MGTRGLSSRPVWLLILILFAITNQPQAFGAGSVTITFQTSGLGSDNSGTVLTIDGIQYVSLDLPIEIWAVGSTHSVSASTGPPVLLSTTAGKQYIWLSWTNGNGLVGPSGTFTAPSFSTTVTANYGTQYFLTVDLTGDPDGAISANPQGAGASSPYALGYYNSGTAVTLTATPSTGYSFSSWTGTGSGSYAGTSNPAIITMNAAIDETAHFVWMQTAPNPSAGILPQSGPVGTTVTVSGTNFAPNSRIVITFGGLNVASTTSDGTGTFHAVFTVPNGATTGLVTVTDASGNTGLATFIVTQTPFQFSISVGSNSLSVTQGSSVSATITASLTSGSTQTVSLSVSGLPSGATPSFNPFSCSPTCTSTLTITTSTNTPAGTYTLTVTATAGTQTSTATVSLIVTPSTSPQQYAVMFSEQGLAISNPNFFWSVTFNGQTESSNSPGNTIAAITFTGLQAGSYSYTVTPPAGGYSASPPSGQVTVNGSVCTQNVDGSPTCVVTISFSAQSPSTYSATFEESGIPSGTSWGVTVGGNRQSTMGSSLTVSSLSGTVSYSYDSTVPGTSGVQYGCASGCSTSISGSTSVAANYQTQYYLTMQANPSNGGTFSPSSGWQQATANVHISATAANSGWQLAGWTGTGSGSCSGSCNAITMNGPITETANFQQQTSSTFGFSINVSPSSGTVQVGGSSPPGTVSLTLTSGSSQSVSLSETGLPGNVGTINFGSTSCSPTCQSSFGIETFSTAPVGSYTIMITGTGGGLAYSATYTLTVTPPSTVTGSLNLLSWTPNYGSTNKITATPKQNAPADCSYAWTYSGIAPDDCVTYSSSLIPDTFAYVGEQFSVDLTVQNVGIVATSPPNSLVTLESPAGYVCVPIPPDSTIVNPGLCPKGEEPSYYSSSPEVNPVSDAGGNSLANNINCDLSPDSPASVAPGQTAVAKYSCHVNPWQYADANKVSLESNLINAEALPLLSAGVSGWLGEGLSGLVASGLMTMADEAAFKYLENGSEFIVVVQFTIGSPAFAEYSTPINITASAPPTKVTEVSTLVNEHIAGAAVCFVVSLATGIAVGPVAAVVVDVACTALVESLGTLSEAKVAVELESSTVSSVTTVTANSSSGTVGNAIVLTVTTTPAAGSGSPPTGSVSWSEGTNSLGSCVLVSGSCTLRYTPTSKGTVIVTATYGGDSTYLGSSGPFTLSVGSTSTMTTSTQTLTTTVAGGSGLVNPKCPNGCSEAVGSSITVTATPSSGWQFSSWSTQTSVSCSSASCRFNMPNNPVTLEVTFSQVTQTLITKVASGSGAVSPYYPSGSPVGVGARVSVSAYPTSSVWQFSSWSVSGASCSGSPTSSPCSFTMPNNPVTLSAYFITTSSPFGFSISVSPGSGTVQAGKASAGTVVLTLTSGSSQSVSLSETGLPGNVGTLSFSSTSCLPTCTSSLSVGTFPGAPAGVYSITITATGGGNTHSTTYMLTVTSGFDFSLSNSGGITVAQGSSNSNTITVTSSPFTSGAITTTQPVSLSCTSGLPLGGLCRFNPLSGNPTFTSTLTVSASFTTLAGSYPITVTGTGGGKTHTTQFMLRVSSPSFDFSIGVSLPSGSVQAGGTSTASVTLTLLSGSSQSVSLSETGLPGNVGTISYNSPSCSPTCTASFSIGTFSGAPAGTYTIAITGTGGGKTHSTTYRLTVSSIAGVENLVTLNSGLSVTEPLLNCENPTTTHCFSVQQNIAVQVSGSSGEYTYWAQNVINVQQNVFGQWEAAAAFNVFNSANKIVACQPGIPPACITGLGFTSFTLPITITMTSAISGNSLVMTSNFGSFTFKLGSSSGNIIYTSSPYPYLNPELAIVGDRSGHQATFGSSTGGQVQSFLQLSTGAWQNASTQTLLSTSNTQTGETAVNLSWTISSGNVARFAYKKGASGEGICFWHL